MRQAGITTLVILIVILGAARASACSCIRTAPCANYDNASAVFIARVISIDKVRRGSSEMPLVNLSIERAFKGVTETSIKMTQGTGSGDCSFVFENGVSYLIYATYIAELARFHTSICTRSAPLKYAGEDLDYLRGLPNSNQSTRLSGTVVSYDYDLGNGSPEPQLISGARVIAEGEDNRRAEAITNSEGFYKLLGLPAGRYSVRVEVPSYLSVGRDNPITVEVPGEGCASASFLARTDGRISGVLMDSYGRVAPDTYIDLLPFELTRKLGNRRIGTFEKTDSAGRFEFDELSPGQYVLGVNLRQNPEAGNPYPRTFYPGVSHLSKAKVIALGRGEKLTGFDLRLPEPLPVRTITGVFVWPDGKPVTKGHLTLKDDAGESLDFAGVDDRGRFVLKALKGIRGWVHGAVFVPVESGLEVVEAIPVRVFTSSNVGPIKLVASRKGKGEVKIVR